MIPEYEGNTKETDLKKVLINFKKNPLKDHRKKIARRARRNELCVSLIKKRLMECFSKENKPQSFQDLVDFTKKIQDVFKETSSSLVPKQASITLFSGTTLMQAHIIVDIFLGYKEAKQRGQALDIAIQSIQDNLNEIEEDGLSLFKEIHPLI
jgi:hypothetical protein